MITENVFCLFRKSIQYGINVTPSLHQIECGDQLVMINGRTIVKEELSPLYKAEAADQRRLSVGKQPVSADGKIRAKVFQCSCTDCSEPMKI